MDSDDSLPQKQSHFVERDSMLRSSWIRRCDLSNWFPAQVSNGYRKMRGDVQNLIEENMGKLGSLVCTIICCLYCNQTLSYCQIQGNQLHFFNWIVTRGAKSGMICRRPRRRMRMAERLLKVDSASLLTCLLVVQTACTKLDWPLQNCFLQPCFELAY